MVYKRTFDVNKLYLDSNVLSVRTDKNFYDQTCFEISKFQSYADYNFLDNKVVTLND